MQLRDAEIASLSKSLLLNTNLTNLDLSSMILFQFTLDNGISNEGMYFISNLVEKTKTLKTLILNMNSFTDLGAIFFGSALKSNQSLTAIHLYRNPYQIHP
jgi:hypothetical protein